MNEPLRDAYLASSDGYSEDRVVCDPALNEHFLSECRVRGLKESDRVLNKSLLNQRKSGHLSGVRRSKRTWIRNKDEYLFAVEMGTRCLERREGVSLDDLICDPDLAATRDKLAGEISPGFSSLEYRWAALALRKGRRLQPETAGQSCSPCTSASVSGQRALPGRATDNAGPLSPFRWANAALRGGDGKPSEPDQEASRPLGQ